MAIANYPTAAGQKFAASGDAAIYTVVYKADGTVDTPSALTPDDTVKITDVKLNGATVTDWSEATKKAGSNKVYTVEVTVKVPKTTTLPLDAENKVPTDKITLSDAMVAAGCTVTGVTAVEADGDDNKFVISVQMPATGAAGYLTGLDTDGDTATRLNPNTENTIARMQEKILQIMRRQP